MAGPGSAIGAVSNSPEYEAMKDCVTELRLAVKSVLLSITGDLLAARLISEEQESYARNLNTDQFARAAELVSNIMARVKGDSKNYHEFLKVLMKDQERHKSIIAMLEERYSERKKATLQASNASDFNDDSSQTFVKSKLTSTAVSVVDSSSQTTFTVSNGQQHQPHPAFGAVCGCTICSSDLGCPKPITAETTFPLLEHVGGLDKLQKEDLRMRLKRETRQIMMEFYALICDFVKSLKTQKIDVEDLKTNLMALEAFDDDDDLNQSVFSEQNEKLERAKTVNQVFEAIKVFFSFFNYDLIEYLMNRLGSDEDKTRFEDYRSKFADYARRRIYECPPKTAACTAEQSSVYIKLESRYSEKLSLNDLREFRFNISKLLKVSQYAIRLCCIEKGCIRLTFQFPNFVKQRLFPLTSDQESSLLEKGVTHLVCGDYEFPNEVKQENPPMNFNTSLADSREDAMSCLDCKTGVGEIPLLCKTHSVCKVCLVKRTTTSSDSELLLCPLHATQKQVDDSYTYRDAVLTQTHRETQIGPVSTQEQQTVSSSQAASKPLGVWMFVNDSNLWIEAKKLQSRQKGFEAGEDHRVRMDMGKLADVLAQGRPIERGVLYGSEPPKIDSVWEKIREKGWEVRISQRTPRRGKEKQVPIQLVVDIVQLAEKTPAEKRSSIIIVSGDAGIVPAIENVIESGGWTVEVYMWSHATSKQLRNLRSERVTVRALDPYLDDIIFTNMEFSYSNKNFLEFVKKSSVVFTVDKDTGSFPGNVPTDQWMTKLEKIAEWPCQYFWYSHPEDGQTNKLVVVFKEDAKAGAFKVDKFLEKVASSKRHQIPCVIRVQSFVDFASTDKLEQSGGYFEQFGKFNQNDARSGIYNDSVYVTNTCGSSQIKSFTKWRSLLTV